MEEKKKILGMDKNICLGLSWLLLPIGIVALAVDHDKMDRREKQTWVSTYVVEGILIIFNSIVSALSRIHNLFSLLFLLAIPLIVFWVIALVKAFKDEDYEYPMAYGIAGKILGEEKAEEKKEEPKEEAKEEPKEEKEEPKEDEEKEL